MVVNIDCRINVMAPHRPLPPHRRSRPRPRSASPGRRCTPTPAAASCGRSRCPAGRASAATTAKTSSGCASGRRRAAIRRRPRRADCIGAARCSTRASPSSMTARCYYRGRDAVALAETASAGRGGGAAVGRGRRPKRPAAVRRSLPPCPLASWRRCARCAKDPLTLLQAALPIAAAVDLASYDLRPAAVRQTGARIVRLLTASHRAAATRARPCTGRCKPHGRRSGSAVADVIRTALVLCADHELNVSAFTARCAASAGASPYDVVSAALATLKGYKHGGAAERVLALAGGGRHAEQRPRRDRQPAAPRRARAGIRPSAVSRPAIPAPCCCCGWRRPAETRRSGGGFAASGKAGSELLHDAPEPGFRTGRGDADLPAARTGSGAPLRAGPNDRLDRARHRGICVRTADPPARPLHGTAAFGRVESGQCYRAVCNTNPIDRSIGLNAVPKAGEVVLVWMSRSAEAPKML